MHGHLDGAVQQAQHHQEPILAVGYRAFMAVATFERMRMSCRFVADFCLGFFRWSASSADWSSCFSISFVSLTGQDMLFTVKDELRVKVLTLFLQVAYRKMTKVVVRSTSVCVLKTSLRRRQTLTTIGSRKFLKKNQKTCLGPGLAPEGIVPQTNQCHL
jgi:hypothetical protein